MKKGVIILVIFILFVVGAYLYQSRRLPSGLLPGNKINTVEINPSETTGSELNNVRQGQLELAQPSLTLEITRPLSGAVVNNANLTVTGKTSTFAEVFVNDTSLRADSQGNFSTIITLDEGENTIVVVANDAAGNFAEKEITVTLQRQ